MSWPNETFAAATPRESKLPKNYDNLASTMFTCLWLSTNVIRGEQWLFRDLAGLSRTVLSIRVPVRFLTLCSPHVVRTKGLHAMLMEPLLIIWTISSGQCSSNNIPYLLIQMASILWNPVSLLGSWHQVSIAKHAQKFANWPNQVSLLPTRSHGSNSNGWLCCRMGTLKNWGNLFRTTLTNWERTGVPGEKPRLLQERWPTHFACVVERS